MVEQEIIDLTQIAKSYLIELGSEMIDEQKKGCDDCADKISWKIQQIIMLVESLYEKIRLNDYGEETESLYSCLLSAVGSYSGASLSVDPNSVNDNITIIVDIIGNNSPNELTFNWSNFNNNGEDGRVRYENSDWSGWNPQIAISNMPFLDVDVDYIVLPSGGFELLPNGNVPAVYSNQIVRAVGYEPYNKVGLEYYIHQYSNPYIDANLFFGINGDFAYQFFQDAEGRVVYEEGTILTFYSYSFDPTTAINPKYRLTVKENNVIVYDEERDAATGSYDGLFFQITTKKGASYKVDSISYPESEIPPVGTYKIVNNSVLDTTYELSGNTFPLTVGQIVNDDLTVGTFISANIQDAQTCTFTVYNGDGSIFYTQQISNSGTINGLNMVSEKSYQFIYTNSID